MKSILYPIFFALLVASLIVTACASPTPSATKTPTLISIATDTPSPSPLPTETEVPTPTPLPTPIRCTPDEFPSPNWEEKFSSANEVTLIEIGEKYSIFLLSTEEQICTPYGYDYVVPVEHWNVKGEEERVGLRPRYDKAIGFTGRPILKDEGWRVILIIENVEISQTIP